MCCRAVRPAWGDARTAGSCPGRSAGPCMWTQGRRKARIKRPFVPQIQVYLDLKNNRRSTATSALVTNHKGRTRSGGFEGHLSRSQVHADRLHAITPPAGHGTWTCGSRSRAGGTRLLADSQGRCGSPTRAAGQPEQPLSAAVYNTGASSRTTQTGPTPAILFGGPARGRTRTGWSSRRSPRRGTGAVQSFLLLVRPEPADYDLNPTTPQADSRNRPTRTGAGRPAGRAVRLRDRVRPDRDREPDRTPRRRVHRRPQIADVRLDGEGLGIGSRPDALLPLSLRSGFVRDEHGQGRRRQHRRRAGGLRMDSMFVQRPIAPGRSRYSTPASRREQSSDGSTPARPRRRGGPALAAPRRQGLPFLRRRRRPPLRLQQQPELRPLRNAFVAEPRAPGDTTDLTAATAGVDSRGSTRSGGARPCPAAPSSTAPVRPDGLRPRERIDRRVVEGVDRIVDIYANGNASGRPVGPAG